MLELTILTTTVLIIRKLCKMSRDTAIYRSERDAEIERLKQEIKTR